MPSKRTPPMKVTPKAKVRKTRTIRKVEVLGRSVSVVHEDGDLWISRKSLGSILELSVQAISEHLKGLRQANTSGD